MNRTKPISGALAKLNEEIKGYALEYGLDFHDVVFEECDYDTINILASLGGFPNRYPHWRFGMDYDQMSKGYRYGLQKIYEMVINTDPCYAYLLTVNNWVDQKIVMAHVYGHADFFKNNQWFSTTNRNMMSVMANHGTKIRRYMERFGQDKVELFIDKVSSIENLLDINSLFETPELERARIERGKTLKKELEGITDDRSAALKSFMKTKKRKYSPEDETDKDQNEEDIVPVKFPEKSDRDIMRFLANYAPLENWESDILGILAEEAYYFLPQRMTKIMNEGWASYWHSTIMTQKALNASEIIDFADHHAGVMAMSRQRMNPYKVGIELFRDIEYRWDTGKFGKEYTDCNDMHAKANWNTNAGLGREKIFEVRKTHNDITFIDDFFTQEFCERQQLFTYTFNPRTGRNEITSRDFKEIKTKLLSQLTNYGTPLIEVEDANYQNRGELLFRHVYYGVDLDMGHAAETMKNVHALWKKPINLVTTFDDKEVVFHFDGKEIKQLTS